MTNGGRRRINAWAVGALLVSAALFGGLGALQLTRALPQKTIVAAGEVFGSEHDPGGRTSGESWNVYIDVTGHGSQIAYGHSLYNAVQGRDEGLPVTVHMRGALVTQVDIAGRPYTTSAVSRREAAIEAFVLLALFALTLAAMVRMVRRSRSSAKAEGGDTLPA
jgi:hypothetical protein